MLHRYVWVLLLGELLSNWASSAAGKAGGAARPASPAQPPDTARLVHLLQLAKGTLASKPDSALTCTRQALSLAQRARLPRFEARAREYLGWIQYARGNYPGALHLYQQALTLTQAVRFDRETALLHADIGDVLREQGAYPEALENVLLALRYYSVMRDSTHLAYALLNVAAIEHAEQHYAPAIAYYQQAIRLLQKNRDQDDLDTSYQGLALVYADQGRYAPAEAYIRLGLAIYRRKKDRTNEAIALNNLGDISCRQHKYPAARQFFGQALALAVANHDESMTAVCCTGLAQVTYQQGQFGESQQYARRSLTTARRIQAQPVAQEAYLILANALGAQRQFAPALAYYKRGKQLADSLHGLRQAAQLDALRNQYQHDRRDQEEGAHRLRIQELEQEQRISRLTLGVALSIGVGVLVLGWLGWRQRRAARQRDQARSLARQASERVEQLLREAQLRQAEYELDLKNRKLTSLTLSVMQKGEFLHEVKERLDVIARSAGDEVRRQLVRLRQSIEQNGPAANEWEQFRVMFEEVHPNFFTELQRQYPDVTPNELRLAALLRLNFTSKAMAGLLGISEESIKKARYRLRQKLQLDPAENLVDFIMRLDGRSIELANDANG